MNKYPLKKYPMADAETKITEDIGSKERAKLVRAAISRMADSLQTDLRLRK